MKTLANGADRLDILRRLGGIRPECRRRWGKMTVAEMVCHASDALRVSMGGRQPKPVWNWFTRSGLKWAALWFPRKWPQGFQTVPECEAGKGGTPPAELERDLDELRKLFDRFTAPGVQFQPHPIFGTMTEKEWMRWGYLHLDHHLRQFGA